MESFIDHFGYLAVLLGTFLEGETVVILAGFAAHRGYLHLPLVIGAAFAGTLIGDQLFYFLGRKHSKVFLARRPTWVPRIEKARKLVAGHQISIILGFRFLYGLRTVIPFTLGAAAVPLRVFVPLNILGALIWALAIGYAGYLFGQTLETLLGRLKHIEVWIMLGIAMTGGAFWAIRFWRARRSNHHDPP